MKGLLQSKTFWGVVVLLLVPLLRRAGLDIGDAAGSEIAGDLVAIAGGAVAIWGRVSASKPIAKRSIKAAFMGGGEQ